MLIHSQNFINNQKIIKKLLKLVDSNMPELILEIGPGNGIISNFLIKTGKKLILIEADKNLAIKLKNKYASYPNVHILNEDFLKYPLPQEPFAIISNIPFNITADIIKKITDPSKSKLDAAYLILQKAAAFKFTGAPTGERSLLANLINIHYEIKYLQDIRRENFTPRPKFDAAFIVIKKKKGIVLSNSQINQFKNFLAYIFNRAPKPSLENALRLLFTAEQSKRILHDIQKPSSIHFKKLSFSDWVKIYKSFTLCAPPISKFIIRGAYSKLLLEQSKLQKIHRTRKD